MNQSDPITPRQVMYLTRLIYRVRKPRYLEAKKTLGLGQRTIMKLTKAEASFLIAELKEVAK